MVAAESIREEVKDDVCSQGEPIAIVKQQKHAEIDAFDTEVKCFLCHEDAKLPLLATAGSIGSDLYSTSDAEFLPGKVVKLPLGLKMAIPSGYYGRISGRSSLALKGLSTLGGVIDSDYRGEVSLIAVNVSDEPMSVKKGDRVAQLIVEKASRPNWIALESESQLQSSERGQAGFGSTGC